MPVHHPTQALTIRREKAKLRSRRYDAKEEVKAHKKRYREIHHEKIKAYQKQYREDHSEESKEYRKKHCEKLKVYRKQYEKSRREEITAAHRRYVENHREEINANHKRWWIEKKYGLTIEMYRHLLELQNNRCAICKDEFIDTKKIHVDHDHATNRVRGILCHSCNTGLGSFKENEHLLKTAIEYLSIYKTNRETVLV